jgi:hypothetical protein
MKVVVFPFFTKNSKKAMIQKRNVYQYISCHNPQAVYDLLVRAGYQNVPKDKQVIAQLLAEFVLSNGEAGLKEMMLIHPDREMILATFPKNATGIKEENGEFISCKGKLMNCDGCPFKSADAEPEKKQISEKTINILIISGTVILGSVLLTLIITNVRNS